MTAQSRCDEVFPTLQASRASLCACERSQDGQQEQRRDRRLLVRPRKLGAGSGEQQV
jgi:hypothetical protein